VRDLCRTRADMVEDRTRARHRLGKFLLRHGRVWRGGTTAWTQAHERWLCCQQFDEPALQTTYAHYRAALQSRDAQLDAIEADLAGWYDRPPFAAQVARLAAYRGVTRLGALTLAAEVGDWRRFARAAAFMGFCGLVPSEYSSGQRTVRGHLTKAGNAHLRAQLVESAWSYQHHPSVGAQIARRQQGLDPQVVARAWAAQLRLCGRFRRLAARKTSKNLVVAAVEVASPGSRSKHLLHPEAGLLRLRSTSLAVADMPEARIVVYTPADEESRQRLPLTRRRGIS
jgi:transposase